MKSNPCCIIVNPRTPKFQCCLWAARLGPVDKKIKPWTQRKFDRILCNIEIWGVGYYLVDVCGVWFFCPSTVLCVNSSKKGNDKLRSTIRSFFVHCGGSRQWFGSLHHFRRCRHGRIWQSRAYPPKWQSKNAEDDVAYSGHQTWQWNNPHLQLIFPLPSGKLT